MDPVVNHEETAADLRRRVEELSAELESVREDRKRRVDHAFALRSEELRAAASERLRLERELAALREFVRDADVELEEARRGLESIEGSRSWRLGNGVVRALRRLSGRTPVGEGALHDSRRTLERLTDRLEAKRIEREPEGRYRAHAFTGGLIYLDLEESAAMRARVTGEYEPDTVALIRARARPGMKFVDVGANKGDFALIAARAIGSSGRILAFEPHPENYRWLRRSVGLNGYPNVETFQVALSDSEGSATLRLGKRSGWHSLLELEESGTGEGIEVRTATLDSALKAARCPRVDMMKIDVAGAELATLRGGLKTLRRSRGMALIVDLHPSRGVDPREVCAFLRKHGFSIRTPAEPEMELADFPSGLTSILAISPG